MHAAPGRHARLFGTALVVGLACLVGPRASEAALSIDAGGMEPSFRPKIHDYTLACDEPITLSVRTPGRSRARIGARRWFAGAAKKQIQLKEGQAIQVVEGTRGGQRERYSIRCLPSSFPQYEFDRFRTPASRFYVVTSNNLPPGPPPRDKYVVIIDRWGVPVWWYRTPVAAIDAKVLDDGSIVWSRYFGSGHGTNPNQAYEFHRPNGTRFRTLRTVDTVTDFHDLQPTSDGNYLLVSYRPRSGVDTSNFNGDTDATVLDAVVQEVTPKGRLVSEWSSEDHIGLAETSRWWAGIGEPYDVAHINAVDPLGGGDFLISLRHTDAVYRIDGRTGDVEWKLGGTTTPQSLEVRGDPHGEHPLGGQHDVRRLKGGDISIYDNGADRDRPPRALRYRIDDGVARLVRSVEDPEAEVSVCCGSTRVTGRSFLTSWGMTPLISEFDGQGRRTFRLHLGDGLFSYRATPVTDEVTRHQLRRGMDSQVAPKD